MSQIFQHLPRLLYIGDVPVEASHHGSALLYRLLEKYPPERLLVIESTLAFSQPVRRLPKVLYCMLNMGYLRLLNSRLHPLYSGWLSWSAPLRAESARKLLGDFVPDAIISVGHGFSWLTAAALAAKLKVPFHLIMHDDWPRLGGILPRWQGWLDQRFAATYRQATSRLCVSPFMIEDYETRYGVSGAVLYPSRSSDCPVFDADKARELRNEDELVIGYGGNGNPDVVSCLRILAQVLVRANARLSIFGPFVEAVQRELLEISPAITFHGMVPYSEMIERLRAVADLLFVPMAFGEQSRDNMTISFPSKLTDYTATGKPLLIYGPPYCSAVRWARMHNGVAEVVDQIEPTLLLEKLQQLRDSQSRRNLLAERAVEIGEQSFNPSSVRELLYTALTASFSDPVFAEATGSLS